MRTLEAKYVLPSTNRTQATEWAENAVLSLLTLTFYRWLWPLNSSERGTKHVFRVNMAQIRSAVPDILHTLTKNTDWRRQKQYLPQFTVLLKFKKDFNNHMTVTHALSNSTVWPEWTLRSLRSFIVPTANLLCGISRRGYSVVPLQLTWYLFATAKFPVVVAQLSTTVADCWQGRSHACPIY